MQIRNQPIAHPYDPNALNASTTVQKSELVGCGVDSVLEKANGDKFYDALKLSLNKIQEQRG